MRRPRPLTYDVPRGLSTGLGDWEVGSKLKTECCTYLAGQCASEMGM